MVLQHALVSLDLENATDKQRNEFNKKLEELNWVKIDNLSTAWKTFFHFNDERKEIIMKLQNGITVAKNNCKVKKVYYAIQVGKEKIEIDEI